MHFTVSPVFLCNGLLFTCGVTLIRLRRNYSMIAGLECLFYMNLLYRLSLFLLPGVQYNMCRVQCDMCILCFLPTQLVLEVAAALCQCTRCLLLMCLQCIWYYSGPLGCSRSLSLSLVIFHQSSTWSPPDRPRDSSVRNTLK